MYDSCKVGICYRRTLNNFASSNTMFSIAMNNIGESIYEQKIDIYTYVNQPVFVSFCIFLPLRTHQIYSFLLSKKKIPIFTNLDNNELKETNLLNTDTRLLIKKCSGILHRKLGQMKIGLTRCMSSDCEIVYQYW